MGTVTYSRIDLLSCGYNSLSDIQNPSVNGYNQVRVNGIIYDNCGSNLVINNDDVALSGADTTGVVNSTNQLNNRQSIGVISAKTSATYLIDNLSVSANVVINGNKNVTFRTNPSSTDYGLYFANGANGQILNDVNLSPKLGAITHNGVYVDLQNGAILKGCHITGYAGASAVKFKDSTAPLVISGAIGAGCAIAIETTGATNDGVFQNITIAYPTQYGYKFGPGSQANRVQGGETAVTDGGIPIKIDRANSTTVANHNTESQPTGGTPSTFYEVGDTSTSTGTHNTLLENINIIANKGAVLNAISIVSPAFGFDINKVRINATQITNSIVKIFTTNSVGKISALNSTGKGASVADIEVAADGSYFGGGRYNISTIWDFLWNKGFKFVLAGVQARSAFPSSSPQPVLDIDIATDTNIGALSIRSRNGDPHVTTYDPTYIATPVPLYNNAVSGGRITVPTAKRLKYTGDFTVLAFIRVASLGSGFCGIAQRAGSWVLRGSQNNTTLPQTIQSQCTIGGVTSSITSSGSIAANTWCMVGIKRTTSDGRLYVLLNDTQNYVASVSASALDGSTGKHRFFNRDDSSSASFLGDIALVLEYDRGLTSGEIRFIYESKLAALGLTAWGTGGTAVDPTTTNLVLKLDPTNYAAGSFPMVPDSSGLGYNGYFGVTKGQMLTHQVDAKTGQQKQGNGTDFEGNNWRDFGVLDDDPATLLNGDSWIRGDLSPPERRWYVNGSVYKSAMTAA